MQRYEDYDNAEWHQVPVAAAAPSDLVDALCEFLEAAVHTVLWASRLYPPELFERVRYGGLTTWRSRHPQLNAYVSDVLEGAKALITSGTAQELAIVLLDAQGAPLERITFCVRLTPSTLGAGGGPNSPHFDAEALQSGFTSAVLLLLGASYTHPLPEGATFELLLYTSTRAGVDRSRFVEDTAYELGPYPAAYPIKSIVVEGACAVQVFSERPGGRASWRSHSVDRSSLGMAAQRAAEAARKLMERAELEATVASVLSRRAEALQQRAGAGGVLAYLGHPQGLSAAAGTSAPASSAPHARLNGRFLNTTLKGVISGNRRAQETDMWEVWDAKGEREGAGAGGAGGSGRGGSDGAAVGTSARAAGSGGGGEGSSGSGGEEGGGWVMTDEEMAAMLSRSRKRGRGGVGPRADDVGPFPDQDEEAAMRGPLAGALRGPAVPAWLQRSAGATAGGGAPGTSGADALLGMDLTQLLRGLKAAKKAKASKERGRERGGSGKAKKRKMRARDEEKDSGGGSGKRRGREKGKSKGKKGKRRRSKE
ncbi:hypothetical protein FOA52_013545 [Chlamydomonas sp. UWO 241]|nr:hypothetical protein FOA52_013545 [Chlamydomonas sp. UWO 241]